MEYKTIDKFIKYCNKNTIKILLAIVENTEFKGLEGQILVNNIYLYIFRFIYDVKNGCYVGYIKDTGGNTVYDWNGDLSEFNMFKEFIISNL